MPKTLLSSLTMKPYLQIPIFECGEPLVPIPPGLFALETPHPYVKLAAPYGDKSPYYLRQGVLESLIAAQTELQRRHPGWKICIFDAYRPIAVQQFMVDYTFAQTLRSQELCEDDLSEAQRQAILEQVYQFWAVPSSKPSTPPPHSTGAAVDVTLVNEQGHPIDMGSPIDEMSSRSYPDYFALHSGSDELAYYRSRGGTAVCDRTHIFHKNRQLLKRVMLGAGFHQHPNEWWHFSLGDQMWAWQMQRESQDAIFAAHYGSI